MSAICSLSGIKDPPEITGLEIQRHQARSAESRAMRIYGNPMFVDLPLSMV